jgi:uncharacterized lipoprotein YddW (UPF0748 family)
MSNEITSHPIQKLFSFQTYNRNSFGNQKNGQFLSCSNLLLLLTLLMLIACDDQSGQTDTKSKSDKETYRVSPVHGVWLTNVDSEVMFSREGLQKAVETCAQLGINTIYAVTWNDAMTMYPSGVMKKAFDLEIDPRVTGWDPLQTLIDIAHAKGIRVIAWFEFGFASSHKDSTGGHMIQAHPEWAARDIHGKIATKNQFQWMNSLHPEVQDFIMSLLKEVVNNYEIDGIQGDDRLPAMPSLAGYDPFTVELYQQENNGLNPPADYLNPSWIDWRAQKLNGFMKRIHTEIKSIDTSIIISMAPSIYPWSKEQYLQDWPTWIENEWVDEMIPQIYRYDMAKYHTELHKMVEHQVSIEHRKKLFPGILLKVGDYLADSTLLNQMIIENRRHGIDGEVFFFYEGLIEKESFRILNEHLNFIKSDMSY